MKKLAMGREATGIAMENNIGIKANLYPFFNISLRFINKKGLNFFFR